MVCSSIENFGELRFLAGYSILQAFRGPSLGRSVFVIVGFEVEMFIDFENLQASKM